MVRFPNGKINIGLRIINKRPDNFHNLETIFYPVNIKDAVEVIPAKHSELPVKFSSSGLQVDGAPESNLCLRAYHLIKADYPAIANVEMHLHKNIPMGAGLGGGSADASEILNMLNQLFNLDIPFNKLSAYALQLGSDCPFFLINKPSLATGRGEILTLVDLNLSNYKIFLVNPRIHVNTGWAFSQLDPAITHSDPLDHLLKNPISSWKASINNDFEKPVFKAFPGIAKIKALLYEYGAQYAAMSGSGSSVFGIFEADAKIPEIFPAGYTTCLV